MNAGLLLLILKDIIGQLEADGLLKSDGTFGDFTITNDVKLAAQIEGIIKARGVAVQSDVDKVMSALPLLLAVVGVR